jgi:hypothetical protein
LIRESGPFIDLTSGEGSSSGVGPSKVKEVKRRLGWHDNTRVSSATRHRFSFCILVKFHMKFVKYK